MKLRVQNQFFMPIVVTLLSLATLMISTYGFSITSLLSPLDGKSDFQVSDLFTRVADKRSVSYLSDKVLVVASDNCTREQIVSLIDSLGALHPNAIGVDINFQYPTKDDSYMLSVFDGCDNIVLPLVVAYDPEKEVYTEDQWVNSFLTEWLEENKFAVVNLERHSIRGPIRSFRPFYPVNGVQIPAFPVSLASLADKETVDALVARGTYSEYINFASRRFEIMTYDDIFRENGTIDENIAVQIEGKVVIIGDLNNSKDFFYVPHEDNMPGVLIHAHCVDTILTGNYIDAIPQWLNILLSSVVCYLFLLLHIPVRKYLGKSADFVIRILQVLIMYLLYRIGCTLYVSNCYVDVSFLLLMIGTSAISVDICYGIEYFCIRLRRLFKNANKRKRLV